MYDEQIEALISAALADGVLTEKEKQILFKRAESMGIDLDEFEMVLDARLVELKKKEANEFVNTSVNSTVQVLVEKLEALDAERESSRSKKFWHGLNEIYKDEKLEERKAQLIETYPIPNTKEDLIEMLTLAHASSKGDHPYPIMKAWENKEIQIIAKADITLKNDADYLALKESWTKKKKKWGLF